MSSLGSFVDLACSKDEDEDVGCERLKDVFYLILVFMYSLILANFQ